MVYQGVPSEASTSRLVVCHAAQQPEWIHPEWIDSSRVDSSRVVQVVRWGRRSSALAGLQTRRERRIFHTPFDTVHHVRLCKRAVPCMLAAWLVPDKYGVAGEALEPLQAHGQLSSSGVGRSGDSCATLVCARYSMDCYGAPALLWDPSNTTSAARSNGVHRVRPVRFIFSPLVI